MGLLSRLRRARPVAPRRPLPPPGVIRRERRAVERVREDRLRDLGGLVLEMYRRDVFREDLVTERCNELLGLDARLRELEEMLAAARHRLPVARCECGAPVPWRSHFCPNCGRPAGEQPVVACAECGHPLQADARFCASCGAPAGETAGVAGVPPATNGAAAEEARAEAGEEA